MKKALVLFIIIFNQSFYGSKKTLGQFGKKYILVVV